MSKVIDIKQAPTVTIDGTEYELSTKLRVAYKVQGQHNHKPYTEIFQNLNDMTIEQQINMLYAAFEAANPEAAKNITKQVFLDHYLDNSDLSEVMSQLQDVIGGILGKDLKEEAEKKSEDGGEDSEGN